MKDDENVKSVKFNKRDEQRKKLDDAFLHLPCDPSWHSVIIDGRCIPRFLARETDEGAEVMLDNRFVYVFGSVTEARMATSLAANALAIGAGYSHLGADSKDMPFAPTVIGMGEL